jgi:hypothetical protein
MSIERVEVGDPIRAKDWNELEAMIRATRLTAGKNVRLTVTSSGTSISFNSNSSPAFLHPHRCQLVGDNAVQIDPGQINTLFPQAFGDVSGTLQTEQFTLRFNKSYDSNGAAWIAAKLHFDEFWQVIRWEYVHTIQPFNAKSGPGIGGLDTLPDGTVNIPIAVILEKPTTTLHQHAYFNLTHRARAEGAGVGQARHLFFAT